MVRRLIGVVTNVAGNPTMRRMMKLGETPAGIFPGDSLLISDAGDFLDLNAAQDHLDIA